jgi:hypothetical protein
MRSVWLRSLALAAGLLLALPPGWCCILPVLTARATASPTTERGACCPCCVEPPKGRAGDETPPPEPVRCPCDDRAGTTLDSYETAGGDLMPAVVLPFVDPAPTAPAIDLPEFLTPQALSSLVHVHCLLLC